MDTQNICSKTDETLPQTIIFKSKKEQFRANCSKTSVTITGFHQLSTQIGIDKLEKIFPTKEKKKWQEMLICH